MAAPAPRALFNEHRDKINETGLALAMPLEPLKVNAAFPSGWLPLPLQKNPLYSHQQWRSPTRRTGVGVTYVHMPLPLSTKTLVWFAMNEDRPLFGSPAAERCSFSAASNATFSGGPTGMATIQFNYYDTVQLITRDRSIA